MYEAQLAFECVKCGVWFNWHWIVLSLVITAVVAVFVGKGCKLSPDQIVLVGLAVLLPPLAVALTAGLGGQFILSLLLTLLGCWVPGIIHAVWVVLKTKGL